LWYELDITWCGVLRLSQQLCFQVEIFWLVMPCSVVEGYQGFRCPCSLHLYPDLWNLDMLPQNYAVSKPRRIWLGYNFLQLNLSFWCQLICWFWQPLCWYYNATEQLWALYGGMSKQFGYWCYFIHICIQRGT